MRKLDVESIMSDDEDIDIVCDECGGSVTLVANDEDKCPFCEARYYTKRTVEVWLMEEGDDVEELEEEESEEEEEEK